MGEHRPRVVAIGGGHGLAMSLRAIRTYAGHLTAVVATGDDGGSSGRLRASFDMPAPGDLRRCLAAVAGDTELAAGLEHRFGSGELEGHAVGNLLLAGLVDAGQDLTTAADLLGRWLGIDAAVARVLPATAAPVTLVATTADGEVRGQVAIENAGGARDLAFDPSDPPVPDDVLAAIDAADQVVLGPGSFVTSVLAAAALPSVAKAIDAATARTVLVTNLDRDPAADVDTLARHGIAVDTVVAQEGSVRTALAKGLTVVEADVDRPHGRAHDADLLGPVLAGAGLPVVRGVARVVGLGPTLSLRPPRENQ
ncbi:MAG: uridine diphosphate-N-acetylglucosamine-binding protein YvcK [Acidimicrobiales bacterium]|nr:uridine diphosphate-N-acetylglucosamine-binding protein YvcK [Acidimicrobiales bacterium]